MLIKKSVAICFLLISFAGYSQQTVFTHQDTLRGTVTKERAWWNLQHYTLDIKVDIQHKSLKGNNVIQYKVVTPYQWMQIDLQKPMEITAVSQDGKKLHYQREGNAYHIKLKKKQIAGTINSITINYRGMPKESKNPPWDDGFTWSNDKNGTDFIATTCQGGGASIWWPCKDHMYDEPDKGVTLSLTIPKNLIGVSNGRLIHTRENTDATKTFTWQVVNPINNYGVNINIGDYEHFSSTYQGEKGPLDCDYYVLSYNLKKAKEQFKQADKMLKAFEYWFGPYPFYEDSYKLVEVPYLGMEHQSSVTYGNGYKNGYLGFDLSGSGWGLKFDFIIIHESGHEWFANNITDKDIADMWIHEGFTAYAESLYLDYYFGTKAANEYIIGTRKIIHNDRPIIGHYNVNNAGSGDMYYKAANMLHTLRQVVNDDNKWRSLLRGLNKTFYHQTVNSQQIENYVSKQIGINLLPFFNQYLRTVKIPVLEYSIKGNYIEYRWVNTVSGFQLPVKVSIDKKIQWLSPTESWKKLPLKNSDASFSVDENWYINTKKMN